MDLKLNTDHDLDISANGELGLVTGVEAVAQHLRIRLKFFQGEWILDTRLGIPYFQQLLGQKPNKAAVTALYRKVILGTPGVERLSALAVDYDSAARKMGIAFTALVAGSDAPVRFEEEVFL